jgi:hypothetical protein
MDFIAIVAVFIVILMLPFSSTLIEKRKVWPYSKDFPFEPFKLSEEHNQFLQNAANQAQDYDFTYLARGYDNKGKLYRIVYDFLISQDGYTLALLGAGTIYTIPLTGAWLFSKTSQGYTFMTVTNQSADEYDLSGFIKSNLIITDDFKKAYHSHVSKLNKHCWLFEQFTPGHELDDLKKLRYQRLEYMEREKWIRFLCDGKDQWKYTVRGGLKWSIWNTLAGIAKYPMSIWKGFIGK